MLEGSGFADEIAAFDAGIAAGDVEQAKAGLSERMLDSLAGIGAADQVRAGVAALPRRRGGFPLHRRHPRRRL